MSKNGLATMNEAPTTSQGLLRSIREDRLSIRWNDFVQRYSPMMRAFLHQHFPVLDGEMDDILQETYLSLCNALPNYRYEPEELGSFHNYLTGILRNRALRALREREKANRHLRPSATGEVPADAAAPDTVVGDVTERELREWRDSVCEVALNELFSNPGIQERTKEVFRRTVFQQESPVAVAEAFGMERNAVDQIKNRMLARLQDIVARVANADKALTPEDLRALRGASRRRP